MSGKVQMNWSDEQDFERDLATYGAQGLGELLDSVLARATNDKGAAMHTFTISDEMLQHFKERTEYVTKLMECIGDDGDDFDARADAQDEAATIESDLVAMFMDILASSNKCLP